MTQVVTDAPDEIESSVTSASSEIPATTEAQQAPQAVDAEKVEQLAGVIAAYGVGLQRERIRAAAEGHAAVQLLVSLGLCTQDEADAQVARAEYAILGGVLAEIEAKLLTAKKAQRQVVQPVQAPGLMVARH